MQPDSLSVIVMTCVLLHNFLRKSITSANFYSPLGCFDTITSEGDVIFPGRWRQEVEDENTGALLPLRPIARRASCSSLEIRNKSIFNK